MDPRSPPVQKSSKQTGMGDSGAGSCCCSPGGDCTGAAAGFRELAKGQVAHSVTSHALEQGGKLQVQDTQHMALC